ncbi:Dr1-associated corepressor [Lonchura striata]|uniref:Dr1-associated corepressor n=1 Tax=Lonchura striata TaxID=40157 RepID=A0A218UB62_9PASE|nr:Dr1-associated corepressor [Lonchura striata domestica]
MPSKKKKYNARFPPARIKKIMQTDEEIGKVAAAVPVIISRPPRCPYLCQLRLPVLGGAGRVHLHPRVPPAYLAVLSVAARALELFLESLLRKACHVTQSRNAKTMTTSHLKQCIELEQQFDFLKDLEESEDSDSDGDEETPPQPPPAPLPFASPGVPFAPLGPPSLPGGLPGGLPPAPGPPRAREEEEEDEDYDS